MSFWQKLPKPFFCLAPMADVTDRAFRQMIVKYSDASIPRVMWTEFVSADGLMSPGREILQHDLKYTEGERPIVAQLFGSNLEKVEGAARLCAELGFDGVDINMGCPDRSIEKQKCGAAMTKKENWESARGVVDAARRGASNLPISVKTRLGYNKVDWDWIRFLLELHLPALTIHLRTRKEMSLVPAHWEFMAEIVKLRDEISPETLIIGNGDVQDLDHARELAKKSGCDGVMLGRAIFGNPFLFSQNKNALSEVEGRLKIMVEHTKLFEELLGDIKSFAIMKKHYKAYVHNFPACAGRPGASELRQRLMDEGRNAGDVAQIVDDFLKTLQ